jgi:hypothetical protein
MISLISSAYLSVKSEASRLLTDEPPTNSRFSPFTPQPIWDRPIPGGVPEPATWVMLLLGVFDVGGALRCRGQRIGLHA